MQGHPQPAMACARTMQGRSGPDTHTQADGMASFRSLAGIPRARAHPFAR